jgi:hypothetical protein
MSNECFAWDSEENSYSLPVNPEDNPEYYHNDKPCICPDGITPNCAIGNTPPPPTRPTGVPCPNIPLSNICRGATDEVMSTNCMALASSPCNSQVDPFDSSQPINGPDDETLDDSNGSGIQDEFTAIYENVKDNETDKIELICRLLGLKDDDGNSIGPNDALPLSKEFNGCSKSIIDRLRNRCGTHGVPLIQCNLDYLNNLWNRCIDANNEDTLGFDMEICPNLIKDGPEDNYVLHFIKQYYNMTPSEREEEFSKDEFLKMAWEHNFIQQKLPGVIAKFRKEEEFSEDPDFNQKYYDELDVMQKCVLKDYTYPRNCLEKRAIYDFYEQSGGEQSLFSEMSEEAQERLINYSRHECVDMNYEGKEVNRFCDYGNPRPPNFYISENPLIIPDSDTILDLSNQGTIINDDEKKFSIYSGTYKCPIGTLKGDSDENPYLNFEDDSFTDCKNASCSAGNNSLECLLFRSYHPNLGIDSQLAEDDSQCYDHNGLEGNSGLCPDSADCRTCERPDPRAFWNSYNCKLIPENPSNIYGHSCDDPFAACVKVATPDELINLKNQFQGYRNRDGEVYQNCNCTDIGVCNCSNRNEDVDDKIINSNLQYPSLKSHNFLTGNIYDNSGMINDRKNLFDKMGNPEEPVYKCMRCGLRGTTASSSYNSELDITNARISSHKQPDFLIFSSNVVNGQIVSTNCTTSDLYWYQAEKGFLEKRFHQSRTLFDLDDSISTFQNAFEASEERIKNTAAEYENLRNRRRETIDNLKDRFDRLSPRISQMIREAEEEIKTAYEDNLDDIEEPKSYNYLIYIMGFFIFVILILFFIF